MKKIADFAFDDCEWARVPKDSAIAGDIKAGATSNAAIWVPNGDRTWQTAAPLPTLTGCTTSAAVDPELRYSTRSRALETHQ